MSKWIMFDIHRNNSFVNAGYAFQKGEKKWEPFTNGMIKHTQNKNANTI